MFLLRVDNWFTIYTNGINNADSVYYAAILRSRFYKKWKLLRNKYIIMYRVLVFNISIFATPTFGSFLFW